MDSVWDFQVRNKAESSQQGWEKADAEEKFKKGRNWNVGTRSTMYCTQWCDMAVTFPRQPWTVGGFIRGFLLFMTYHTSMRRCISSENGKGHRITKPPKHAHSSGSVDLGSSMKLTLKIFKTKKKKKKKKKETYWSRSPATKIFVVK